MSRKKNPSVTEIITFFMDYVLEHDAKPKSVYSFAKANNFEESKFYEKFASFEVLESHVFRTFFDASLEVLEASEEYATYDSRQKLISFYYTFFENLTANRSFVVYLLDHGKSMKSLKALNKLKKSFKNYIDHLEIETIDLKQERLEKLKDNSLKETAWIQLLLTMKFWLDDTSVSFEKTDVYIEKSLNTSFDLIDTKLISSVIDFGKFLFKEKLNFNS